MSQPISYERFNRIGTEDSDVSDGDEYLERRAGMVVDGIRGMMMNGTRQTVFEEDHDNDHGSGTSSDVDDDGGSNNSKAEGQGERHQAQSQGSVSRDTDIDNDEPPSLISSGESVGSQEDGMPELMSADGDDYEDDDNDDDEPPELAECEEDDSEAYLEEEGSDGLSSDEDDEEEPMPEPQAAGGASSSFPGFRSGFLKGSAGAKPRVASNSKAPGAGGPDAEIEGGGPQASDEEPPELVSASDGSDKDGSDNDGSDDGLESGGSGDEAAAPTTAQPPLDSPSFRYLGEWPGDIAQLRANWDGAEAFPEELSEDDPPPAKPHAQRPNLPPNRWAKQTGGPAARNVPARRSSPAPTPPSAPPPVVDPGVAKGTPASGGASTASNTAAHVEPESSAPNPAFAKAAEEAAARATRAANQLLAEEEAAKKAEERAEAKKERERQKKAKRKERKKKEKEKEQAKVGHIQKVLDVDDEDDDDDDDDDDGGDLQEEPVPMPGDSTAGPSGTSRPTVKTPSAASAVPDRVAATSPGTATARARPQPAQEQRPDGYQEVLRNLEGALENRDMGVLNFVKEATTDWLAALDPRFAASTYTLQVKERLAELERRQSELQRQQLADMRRQAEVLEENRRVARNQRAAARMVPPVPAPPPPPPVATPPRPFVPVPAQPRPLLQPRPVRPPGPQFAARPPGPLPNVHPAAATGMPMHPAPQGQVNLGRGRAAQFPSPPQGNLGRAPPPPRPLGPGPPNPLRPPGHAGRVTRAPPPPRAIPPVARGDLNPPSPPVDQGLGRGRPAWQAQQGPRPDPAGARAGPPALAPRATHSHLFPQEGQMEQIEAQRNFVMPAKFDEAQEVTPADAGSGIAINYEEECTICMDAIPIYAPIPCRCKAMYCQACVKQHLPVGANCHVCGTARPRVTGSELVRTQLAYAHQRGQALDVT